MTPKVSDSAEPLDTYSPISLRENSAQALSQSVVLQKPMTLFAACVDIIVWNPNKYYPASLKLPCSMRTTQYAAKLQ